MHEKASVYVATSNLGQAVFAGKPFARKKRIGRVTGQVIRGTQYDTSYCMEFGEERVLDPEPPFRFLNHSCTANCELVIWRYEDPADWQIHVYATKPIEPMDELTIDYAFPSEDAIPCLCGSKLCRGWIVAENELSHVKRLQHQSISETCQPI